MKYNLTFRRGRHADGARRSATTHPRLESLEDRQLLDGKPTTIDFGARGDKPVQAAVAMVRNDDGPSKVYMASDPSPPPAGLAGTSHAALAITNAAPVLPIVVSTTSSGSQTTVHFKVYDTTR